jgi:hypothetical protein
MSFTVELISPGPDQASELHKQATVLKEAGDWAEAILKLQAAKLIMLESGKPYTPGMWFRLAGFLQHAGRYDEALSELGRLQCDSERLIGPPSDWKPSRADVARGITATHIWRRQLRHYRLMLARERDRIVAREMRKTKAAEKSQRNALKNTPVS